MKKHSTQIFTTSTMIALLSAVATPQISIASASAAMEIEGIQEIVITSQRRTESLQDVPIAATVLTGEMLARKGVEGISSLQYAAPGLTMADYGSANVLNIRGIGRSAVDIELPSGVVIYRDGVPTFPGYFQNEPYYDIAAIEVLRGAQGTFVGKSAAGGAIFIRTASPELDEFSGKIEAEYGNYDQYGLTGVVNAPLGDTFALRVAFRHFERTKILGDSLTGPYTGRPGRPNLDSARIGALWEPNSNLKMEMRLDLSDLDFGGNLTSSYQAPLYDYVQDANFKYRDRSARFVGDIEYSFDNGLQLTSVTGYQYTHTVNNFDRNGANPRHDRFDSEGVFELYSEEINLISPDDSEHPFSYVLGFFIQRTNSTIEDFRNDGFNFYGEVGDLGGLVQGKAFPYLGLNKPYKKKEDEISGFVDVKYKFEDKFIAELGIRYSNYKTSNDTEIVLGDGLSEPTIPFFAGQQELSENDLDGKLSFTYLPSEDHSIYALVSRAHVTAGFNIIGGVPFDKEIVYNYEAGWKASWMENRVRTQLGAYYQTLSNYQAQFANADLAGQNLLQNAEGKSKIYGFEASMQAQLNNLRLDVSLAYLHSELGTFPNVISPFLQAPNNVIAITGAKTPFAPEFSFNAGASYQIEVNDRIVITPRVDISGQSKQNGALFQAPQTKLPGRTLLNAGLMIEYDAVSIDFWVRNLTDKRFVAGIQDLGNIWYPAAPRQYGVRVAYRF